MADQDLGVCQAWPACRAQATQTIEHPALGVVPACDPHAADVTAPPAPQDETPPQG